MRNPPPAPLALKGDHMYSLIFSSASSQSRCHSSAVLPSRTASHNAMKTVIIAKKLVHPCLKLFQETWLGNAASWGPEDGGPGRILVLGGSEAITLPPAHACSPSLPQRSQRQGRAALTVCPSAHLHMGTRGYEMHSTLFILQSRSTPTPTPCHGVEPL